MKQIIFIISLLSLFSYLIAESYMCPPLYYICCKTNEISTCNCIPEGMTVDCQLIVSCDDKTKSPYMTVNGKTNRSQCV